MTEHRFESGEPRIAGDEPRIDGGGAPNPRGNGALPSGSMAPDASAHESDGLDKAALDAQADEAPADPRLIAKPSQFAAVREEKGWSVNEVAGRLRMQVRQIEAIEAGRWQDLPGTAFVRAAIRSYARLLDRDPAPLLASVAQLDTGLDLRSTHRPPVAISPTGSFGETSGVGRWGLALLGLLAVIAIAFYFAPSGELRWPSQWFEGEGGGTSLDAGSTIAGEPSMTGSVSNPARGALPSAASPSDDAVAAAARAANELLGSQAGTDGPAADGASPRPGAASPEGVGGAPGPASPEPASATRQAEGAPAGAQPGPAAAETAAAGGAAGTAPDPVADARDAPAPQGSSPTEAPAVAGATEAAPPDAGSGPDAGPGPGASAGTIASAAPSTAAAGVPESSLMMIFDAECWVEVSDAQGKRLVYGLQKPRTSLSLDVPGPVSVLIGNADAVTMTRGGEPVDVRSQARDGVARLRLE